MTTNDPRADLAYIRQLMEDTRRATYVSGGYFIVWGIAIGLGLLLTWLQLTGHMPMMPMVSWTGCLVLGGIGTLFLIREEMNQPVQTPAGRLIGMVWMSIGISMLIIFFVGVGSGVMPGSLMTPVSSTLVGAAVFLTGTLASLNWVRNLALGWWLGAAAMFAWPGLHVLLLMGVMLFVLYVIPGVILIRQKQTTRS